jgi:hypothetical protein
MTAKQYASTGEASQCSFDDECAGVLQRTEMSEWSLDTEREVLNIYIFPREVLTSEPSILYDQCYHRPKHPISKAPVEILSTIFHQLPLFDRVNLVRCSKRLAQIAIENKILELEFKDRGVERP